MRYLFALVCLILGTAGGLLVYRNFTEGPPVVLAAPQKLEVLGGNSAIQASTWSNSGSISVDVAGASHAMGADVEVRPLGQAFTGSPTQQVKSSTVPCSRPAGSKCAAARPVRLHLSDGVYHLQARLHDGQGVSPWMPFRDVIRVDTAPPSVKGLSSPTDPNPTRVYHSGDMTFQWSGVDKGSGVTGYSYRLDSDPHGQALPQVRTASLTVALHGLQTGLYYFHVRALDRAGNWGPNETFPVHVDVTPPGLNHISFSTFDFNPRYDHLGVSFQVTQASKTVRVGVYRHTDGALMRLFVLHDLKVGQPLTVSWNGTSADGKIVPAGEYSVYIRAIDQYGISSVQGWRGFFVEYKRIVVSLSQQRLWAYDGNSAFLTSLVTTGNQALPTPTGTFRILGKFHPFTFHSSRPKTSPFWYPPSLTQWAMLFQSDGYFIHDAPWRSVFGPGSNAQAGTPGNNYTGTHGCINVPGNIAQQLYAWAPIGTTVIVQK
jgi:L,D-transpeptidase catalytic domain